MSDRLSPRRAIVQITGNAFGSGDELAHDILASFESSGYALVDRDDLAFVNRVLKHQHRWLLEDLLAQDAAVCHHSRYRMECLLPVDHDGIHRYE